MKALLLPGSAVWKDFLMENAAFFMGGHAIDDVMWKAGLEPSPLFFSFFFYTALLSTRPFLWACSLIGLFNIQSKGRREGFFPHAGEKPVM